MKVFAPAVPQEYKDRWLTMTECRQLAELMSVPEMRNDGSRVSRPMTWNRLKDCLPYIGYTVDNKKRRVDGKLQQCYYIKGEWHDAEIQDNEFLALADAAAELKQQQLIEE